MKAKIMPYREGDLEIKNPKNHRKFCHLVFYKYRFSIKKVGKYSKFVDEIAYAENGIECYLNSSVLNFYRRLL
jgi:hypothetical protein